MTNLRSMPLLPEEGFDLYLSGGMDGERFAGIFRNTWWRLPAGARHALIARWWDALDKPRPDDVPAVPCFLLAENLTDLVGTPVAGLYVDHMNVFAWHAPTMDWLGDELVAAAVAHELGHGVVAEVSRAEMEHEHTIDKLVERWGFPGHALRALARKATIEAERTRC